MEQNNFNTYFTVDNRCTQNNTAAFFIYPVTKFNAEQRGWIDEELTKVWHKYFPMCSSAEASEELYVYYADYQYIYNELHDKVIPDILDALDNIEGIGNVIVTDGDDPYAEPENQHDTSDIDKYFGIPELKLYYTAHADGIIGENLFYNIYFNDGIADDNRLNIVRDAVNNYDYGLIDDDYSGYMSITAEDGKVSVYLDLGNVRPQNEDNVIHGILLALNQIPEIEKVIINEGIFY